LYRLDEYFCLAGNIILGPAF